MPLCALVPILTALSGSALARAGEPGLQAIRGQALSAHIRFLADDLLEGRAPGTAGHAIAARYLATQLASLGVEPAGDARGWIQSVPLIALRADPSRCSLRIGSGSAAWTLREGVDLLVSPSPSSPDAEVSGMLVFAGHGVVAPMYRYDDTPRDLRGRVVVVLARAPRSERDAFFPSAASAVLGDGRRKLQQLSERGAVAVLVVPTAESLSSYPWPERVRDRAAFERMDWMEKDGSGSGGLVPSGEISPESFERLLRRAGRKETIAHLLALSKAGKLRPFDLGLPAILRTGAATRRLSAENVVGVLKGSDPVRSTEYVVVSAHLDHLGVGPAVGGDTVYNGALDDAAGVGSLIEIARAFASLPQRPARSILFLGCTAEEKGMIGSDYFAQHPTVPLEAIVADVNSDDVFGHWRPREVHALGAEHCSLGEDARAAAEALGLSFGADPDPGQVYYIRGDQYSFVRRGVPSVQPGISYRDENGDETKNRVIADAWMEKRYHQPSDEWDPALDYENMAVEVRYYFLIALSAAIDPQRPAWNPGDVFEKLFARSK